MNYLELSEHHNHKRVLLDRPVHAEQRNPGRLVPRLSERLVYWLWWPVGVGSGRSAGSDWAGAVLATSLYWCPTICQLETKFAGPRRGRRAALGYHSSQTSSLFWYETKTFLYNGWKWNASFFRNINIWRAILVKERASETRPDWRRRAGSGDSRARAERVEYSTQVCQLSIIARRINIEDPSLGALIVWTATTLHSHYFLLLGNGNWFIKQKTLLVLQIPPTLTE